MTSPPPLSNLHVLELAGLAPGPFCGFLLSSYGASVLRIDRPGSIASNDLLTSYKSSIALDLKSKASHSLLLSLVSKADVLIDPFRPGVLERLGLDPVTVLQKINPRLIVVRLTGFRRDGKYKDMAGHDINYLAVSGVLSMLGEKGRPPLPPGNVLADFAGGGHVACTGVLLALIHRGVSGKGQIVEVNMADGVNYLGTYPRLLLKHPMWNGERGTNTLDGGAPYYGCYECKDAGRYMSVGSLEPQFFEVLLKGLGLTEADIVPEKDMRREDKRSWEHMRLIFTARFKTRTREEWEKIFDGTDACCVPVLTFDDLEVRDYDFRPLVGLTESPAKEVDMKYHGRAIKPGDGAENALREWMGWQKGQEWDVSGKGAAELRGKSKL
ncbi:hypothetical protein LTR05_005441 [Lithohypha guttulata]|uniref:Alpha-methylacyl-CoA racemase n=1 Tax=Lithohypha guttulata TaxID=1690604 RepID=A0AAN7SXS4_9EURO|nr:hypothetical protein LTR05_005441 [Lithohypha guttulata]